MSKIKHILSVIHYTICGALCFNLPISFVIIEKIYILCLIIIIKSEVWTITHCLRLGHERMVCAVCLSIFLSAFGLNILFSVIQSIISANIYNDASTVKFILITASDELGLVKAVVFQSFAHIHVTNITNCAHPCQWATIFALGLCA